MTPQSRRCIFVRAIGDCAVESTMAQDKKGPAFLPAHSPFEFALPSLDGRDEAGFFRVADHAGERVAEFLKRLMLDLADALFRHAKLVAE